MPSTRCHAAVINGEVHRNVIVSYDSVERSTDVALHPFEGEVHSTDDFNGAILILPAGADFDLAGISIAPATFSSVLQGMAMSLPHVEAGVSCRLLFLPL